MSHHESIFSAKSPIGARNLAANQSGTDRVSAVTRIPGAELSKSEFLEYLLQEYPPHSRERIRHEDQTYVPGTTYPQICQTRTYLLYQSLIQSLDFKLPGRCYEILDVGIYPGTQARVLAHLLGDRIRLSGIGLLIDEALRQDMSAVTAQLEQVDLDPFYAGLDKPIRVRFPDASFDAIYALEIFEHFISPLSFLSECSRLLKSGGILCLSTPNVSHIGAICQLICGRSNHEPLDSSPMYQVTNEWRGHSRIYAKHELIELFSRFGLRCVRHRYYREAGSRFVKMSRKSRLKSCFRRLAGWLIPQYRDDQFVVFQKNSNTNKSCQ